MIKLQKQDVFSKNKHFQAGVCPMRIYEINPLIRFAEQFTYHSFGCCVRVTDCRIFYILKGTGEIDMEHRQYPLLPGSFFFCRENSVYTIFAKELSLISLNFDLRWSETASLHVFPPCPVSRMSDGREEPQAVSNTQTDPQTTARTAEDSPDCDMNFPFSHIYLKNGELCLPALQNILSEFSERKSYFREKAGAVLKELLTELVRIATLPANHSSDALQKTIAYIQEHYREPIRNCQLAAAAGYHEYHLNRLFLSHTGQSLHHYILTQRLDAAKRLLITTELPLSEIAEQVGFHSGAHFSSCFKKTNGIAPSQYRSQFKISI